VPGRRHGPGLEDPLIARPRPGLAPGRFCRRIASSNCISRSLKLTLLPAIRCEDVALPAALCAELNAARDYARQSLSPATRRAYEGDWRAFQGWCTDRGIEALPASPASVAAWLARISHIIQCIRAANQRLVIVLQ
jgi:hypothetical protein